MYYSRMLMLLLAGLLPGLQLLAQPFITRWNLATAGSGPTQITFGVGTTGPVNYTWETIPAGTSGSGTFSGNAATITGLPVGAVIRLSIDTANVNRFVMNYGQDRNRLLDVEQWGAVHWVSMENAFYGCGNLNITATDLPDLSATTSLASMFKACASLTGPPNIGNWNTSTVTNMSAAFCKTWLFNQPIGNWDVSNVSTFDSMFHAAFVFNQPLANWDVSSASVFTSMFSDALAFNQPIGNWNLQNAVSLRRMFRMASAFNQPIGTWNTQGISDMGCLFWGASAFNQPIGTWNTQNVITMDSMFREADAFNQPIGTWNTANVTNMRAMFKGAVSFNQAIGSWNVSAVTTFQAMFQNAVSFNQPIGTWNIQSATDLSFMFNHADSFDQPIGSWNTQNVTTMAYMFFWGLVFNQPIGSWNTQNVTNMYAMFNLAVVFNQPIGLWNTQNVTDMSYMFAGTLAFNQPLGAWNTQNVNLMRNMFSGATAFNQPIGSWSTQNVTDMRFMFYNAANFNQPIGSWNTTNVTDFNSTFRNAVSFNQTLANWNTANVNEMRYMFSGASAFDQPIGGWALLGNVVLANMLDNCGMSCTHYSATLNGWANNPNTAYNRHFGAANMKYLLNGQIARNTLISVKGWTIYQDSLDNGSCCVVQQGVLEITACGSYVFNGQTLSSSGIHLDTLVSQSGCDSLLTLILTIQQPSAFSFSDTACMQYVFNNQTLTAGGTYFDTLVNAAGCDSILTLYLTINTVDTSVTQAGAFLSANATGATYQWLRCNPYLAITGETNQSFVASANGSYAVAVTMNGCTDTSSCYTLSGVGLMDEQIDHGVNIFPNPVSGSLYIESARPLQGAGIRLLNPSGQVVLERQQVNGNRVALETGDLPSGLYVLQISDAEGRRVRKVVKE